MICEAESNFRWVVGKLTTSFKIIDWKFNENYLEFIKKYRYFTMEPYFGISIWIYFFTYITKWRVVSFWFRHISLEEPKILLDKRIDIGLIKAFLSQLSLSRGNRQKNSKNFTHSSERNHITKKKYLQSNKTILIYVKNQIGIIYQGISVCLANPKWLHGSWIPLVLPGSPSKPWRAAPPSEIPENMARHGDVCSRTPPDLLLPPKPSSEIHFASSLSFQEK